MSPCLDFKTNLPSQYGGHADVSFLPRLQLKRFYGYYDDSVTASTFQTPFKHDKEMFPSSTKTILKSGPLLSYTSLLGYAYFIESIPLRV